MGKVLEFSSKCCSFWVAFFSKCLKLVELFFLFPRQDIREQWPADDAPWREREITFYFETVIKQSWEALHFSPAEKHIQKTREKNPVTSETMHFQDIRCTAVR